MRFGVALPHYDFSLPEQVPLRWEGVRAFAIAAEEMGFDSLWISDHLAFDLEKYGGDSTLHHGFEWSTALGALANATSRMRLGTLVLCAPLRPAPLVARAAGTIDRISGGRFELGLGAGWYPRDFELARIGFRGAAARIRQVESAALDVASLLEEFDANQAGAAATNRRRPPITIGGKGGPRILSAVARAADGWNIAWSAAPDEYRKKLEVLEEACQGAGRDISSIDLSVGLTTLAATTENDLRRRMDRLSETSIVRPQELSQLRRERLAGTVAEVKERVATFESMNVSEIICNFGPVPFSVNAMEDVEIFAEHVICG